MTPQESLAQYKLVQEKVRKLEQSKAVAAEQLRRSEADYAAAVKQLAEQFQLTPEQVPARLAELEQQITGLLQELQTELQKVKL